MPRLTGKWRMAYLYAKLVTIITWEAIYITAYALVNTLIFRTTTCLQCGNYTNIPVPKDTRYCRECMRKNREHDKRREQLFGGPQGVASTEERFPVKDRQTGKNGYKPEK